MNTTPATTYAPLAVDTRIKIEKGCKARGIDKGCTAEIIAVTALGADYSHQVQVRFRMLNGFKAGRTFAFSARHINRLADAEVRMNDGDPTHLIIVRRA